MHPRSSYIEIAKSVLLSPELALGPHSITCIDQDIIDRTGRSLPAVLGTCFVIQTSGLYRNPPELLALLTQKPNDEVFQIVHETARQFGVKTPPVCVAPVKQQELAACEQCQVWTLTQFFDWIFTLGDDLPRHLRENAAIQRPNEFKYFQERKAICHVQAGHAPRQDIVNLDEYFESWLSSHKRKSPILLIGERGSGKTWQLLHFAMRAYELNRSDPWQWGPALFVRLTELVNLVEESSAATPVLTRYLSEKYPDMEYAFGDTAVLGALFRSGHTVVCVDGFDEMDVIPSDERVRARLTTLLLLLSKTTRFVLSSRAAHFNSLRSLFDMSAWGDSTVAETFEVLELAVLDAENKLAYLRAASTGKETVFRQLSGLDTVGQEQSALQRAVDACAQHPGFLAQIVASLEAGMTNPVELIEKGIVSVMLEFNLLQDRTRSGFPAINSELTELFGDWVDLSLDSRISLLSDIAWYMAERQISSLDLARLPPRFRLWYGIQGDALERDLRSQTVFEFERRSQVSPQYSNPPNETMDGSTGNARGTTSLARFTLQIDNTSTNDVGESSVCGAYFLARHIEERLFESGPVGPIPDDARFRFLGSIPLGPLASAMLRGRLNARSADCVRQLGRDAWAMLRRFAEQRTFRVFCPSFRYLASNLRNLGAISECSFHMLEPWTGDLCNILAPPMRMPSYEMALIPGSDATEPFLLGVHEVTNQQYLSFLEREPVEDDNDSLVNGREWTVTRMTVAGSRGGTMSPNNILSNEYHLFFWLPHQRDSQTIELASSNISAVNYLPPGDIYQQPVTYVSWYASAAFCDWLSIGNELDCVYRPELSKALGRASPNEGRENTDGYRLPTRCEWTWAARGGHKDVDRPWELFPFHISKPLRTLSDDTSGVILNQDAWEKFHKWQVMVRHIMLSSGKQLTDVLHDDPNDFGVSGLIGNVREWCHDEVPPEAGPGPFHGLRRYILGATSYLGEPTFHFEYKTPLYPGNTNPDVGFRVARSLTPEEVLRLQLREEQIATLPETPPEPQK